MDVWGCSEAETRFERALLYIVLAMAAGAAFVFLGLLAYLAFLIFI